MQRWVLAGKPPQIPLFPPTPPKRSHYSLMHQKSLGPAYRARSFLLPERCAGHCPAARFHVQHQQNLRRCRGGCSLGVL